MRLRYIFLYTPKRSIYVLTRFASVVVLPLSEIGVWGEIAPDEKVHMNNYYIFMTPREVPPMSSAGVRGLQALACPKGSFPTVSRRGIFFWLHVCAYLMSYT